MRLDREERVVALMALAMLSASGSLVPVLARRLLGRGARVPAGSA
jgi:hypothetical protein